MGRRTLAGVARTLPAITIYFKLGYVPSLHLPEMYTRWYAVCQQLGRRFEPDLWTAELNHG